MAYSSIDPAAVEQDPSWRGSRTYAPKGGLAATLDGSIIWGPKGQVADLGAIIAAGGVTTTDPYLQDALEETGLFNRTA